MENGTGWSNNTTTMTGVCDELLTEFSDEFNDCTLVLGRQGIHSGGFFNFEFVVAQPLEMRTIVDDENPYWTNVTLTTPRQPMPVRPSLTSAPFVPRSRSLRRRVGQPLEREHHRRLG